MTRAGPAGRPGGFTLVELVVGLLLTGIVTAGAMAILTQQQRALQGSSTDRALQETVRTALGELGSAIRRAGYGVEPSRAIDFDGYACTGGAVVCRDRVDGPDEIVLYARDPAFRARLAAAPTATTLTIAGGLAAPLRRGQILQVMCGAAAEWAYVTVGQGVAANWAPPAAAPASTPIPLEAATGAFPDEGGRLVVAGSCFQSGVATVRVYRVDRLRYFVAFYADPDSGAAQGRPYLMLDRGLRDDDGTRRLEPVAPDVEDIQFEYAFVSPSTNVTRTVGDVPGTALASSDVGIHLAATPPVFGTKRDDPIRETNHPGNIRAVRVHVVARSAGPDLTKATTVVQLNYAEGAALPPAANRPSIAGEPNHVRIRVATTQAVRNLETRTPYYEP